jgi:ATP synthase subunit 6
MKQQIYNFLTSPLEQFENNAIILKPFQPQVPEAYLQWFLNNDYGKLVEFEMDFYFDANSFIFLQDKIVYIFFVVAFLFCLGVVLNVSKDLNFLKVFNIQLFTTWIFSKFIIIFLTITTVTFEYIIMYSDVSKQVEVLMLPLNHSGFILNDSMCFFISAALFLYLCTAFQDFHSSKGPFIINKNPLTSLQLNIHKVTVELLGSSIDRDIHSQSYHAFVYGLFTYLVICNVQGLIPFTITVTSHLICTFFLAQVVMLYVIITILAEKGFRYFLTLFMPSGAPILLGYLLIPIEIVSFFFKTVSLSVRLFANMMAGHTLLKVILGFAWTILVMSEVFFIVNLFPIVILILLTVLEIGVSIIQAYIFSILTCLYLRDAFKGH